MTLPYGYQGGAIPVRQDVEFMGTAFVPKAAQRIDSLPAGMAVEPVALPQVEAPFELEDPRLEEHPFQDMGCRPPPVTTGQRFRTREEAMRAAQEAGRRRSGTVILLVTVDVDGKVVPGSDSLVKSDNPLATEAMVASLMQCRFLQARIGGVPVPARAIARMTVIAGAGPP